MRMLNQLKIYWIAVLMVFGTGLLSPNAEAASDRVGYVNLSLIFDSYHKTKEHDRTLEQETEMKRKEREELVNQIKSLRDEIELLSEQKRASKQGEIDEKVRELQAFDKDARENLRRRRDEMLRDILKEIDVVVSDYGKSEGYEYIFNDRVLIYKDEANDLSQKIISILNKSNG